MVYYKVIVYVANKRIGIDLDDGVKVMQGDGKKDLKGDLLFKVNVYVKVGNIIAKQQI